MFLHCLALGVADARPLVRLDRRAEPTLIRDVRVFDSELGVTGPPQNVWLRDGRIFAIRLADPAVHDLDEAAAGARIVEGAGRTLLPGLIDVHSHVGGAFTVPGRLRIPNPERNLAAWVYSGVTTILDLSAPIEDINSWRRRVARGRLPGPLIYASGRPFTAPGGHPVATIRQMFPSLFVRLATRHAAHEVADEAAVDKAIASEGPRDFIKVVLDAIPDADHETLIGDEALARLRVGATALDRKMIAHVGRPSDVHRALQLPVDALAHLPYTGQIYDPDVREISDLGIPVIPTLSVWDSLGHLADGRPMDDPLQASVLTRGEARDFADAVAGRTSMDGPLAEWGKLVATSNATRIDNVARLRAAGGQILVGADGPILGLAAGAGTHRELDLLRGAGLTPAETLIAATWANSRFLDPNAQFGAVRVGWEADLLLVIGDPIEDPGAIHRIAGVWVDGRAVAADWPK